MRRIPRKPTRNCYVQFSNDKFLVGRFMLGNRYYVCLLLADDGNRWDDPAEITKEEFETLVYGNKAEIKKILLKAINQKYLNEIKPNEVKFITL